MQELKLHSFGQNDHLESLKEKYDPLKKRRKILKIIFTKSELSKFMKTELCLN